MSKQKLKHDNNDEALVYKVGRTIYFFDDIESDSVCKAIQFLDELDKDSKKEIEIVLSSPGGFIYEGFALYDRIRRCSSTVNIIGTGMVASMAVIVFLAGDYRYVTENCILLNHQAYDEIEGRTTDLEIAVKETKRIENRAVELVAKHTRLTETQITKDIQKGDDYILPDRAVSDGFAHEVLKNEPIRRPRKRRS